MVRVILVVVLAWGCWSAERILAAPAGVNDASGPGPARTAQATDAPPVDAVQAEPPALVAEAEKPADSKEAGEAKESSDDKKSEEESDKKSSAAGDEKADKPKEDKAPAKEEKPEAKKPEPHKVETKKLTIEMEVEGAFVASEMTEVPLRPKKWSKFEIVEAKPHGVKVRKGDVLVKFDDEDLEKAIADASLDQRLGELTMMETEEQFPRLEKAVDLNFTQAKRNYDQFVEEFKRFKETMRPLSEKMAKYNLKSAEQYLQNAEEELKQLRQMYEADELTEETEEIVLKRQEFEVEYAKFYVEYSRINHDYTMNVAIPRRQEALELGLEEATLSFDHAKTIKSVSLPRERYKLEQLREARAKSVAEHAKLLSDRDLMTLRAPVDGIVYYGRCVDGRWAEIGSYKSKLQPHGTASPNSVPFTIVSPDSLYMLTSIGEKDFPSISVGQSGTASPVADPEVELPAKVRSVEAAPGAGNKFAVELELDCDKSPEWLLPGMSCKAKFTTYVAEDAIVIPADLVRTDDDNPKLKYVMVVEKSEDDEDKPVRREIKLGKTKGKEVEVLKGLKAGDLISKEPPKKD
ncbi:MAG: hypothetical protein KF847_17030 [Pirellulales bacterium]|nr:hypothetical protein [Pirellulales bacterium]